MPESRLQLIKTITGNISRPFVKYPKGESEGHVEIHRPDGVVQPLVSIIIPTVGAAVGVGWDFYDAGYEAGKIAVRVIKGEKPANIPFQFMQSARLSINLKAAELQNLKIPDAVIARAKSVIR